MDPEELERSVALQELCRFLSACYYEPGPEFLEERVFDSMVTVAKFIGPEFEMAAHRLGNAFEAEGPDRLLVDYTHLFLGPVQVLAKPYESSWSGTDDSGPESIHTTMELYREGGFDVSDDFHELPDHIAVELEYLYLLRSRENHGRQTGNVDVTNKARGLRCRLLAEHLGRWTVPFTAEMKAGAETNYYRELADLTSSYVNLELVECGAVARS